MNREIKSRVKRVLVQILPQDIRYGNIEDDSPLIDLGIGVDSVATLELIVALEREFQVSIDESEVRLEMLESVNSISDHIVNLNLGKK